MTLPLVTDTTPRAVLSPCGRYRFRLSREWGDPTSRVLFVMLNPSTADAEKDDPTIRRCIGFARDWGFGALDVANLFALRSTDPKALYTAEDPIGPGNDMHIAELAIRASRVLLAWGAHGRLHGRGAIVRNSLPRAYMFGSTKYHGGQPQHPLYIPRKAMIFIAGGSDA